MRCPSEQSSNARIACLRTDKSQERQRAALNTRDLGGGHLVSGLHSRMTCTLASCVLPGTSCSNAERTASGSRATCCHVRAPQALRQLHSGRWHHGAAAATAAPITANLRGLLQHSARHRIRLSARRLSGVVATMPDPTTPETEKERSPLDYPQVCKFPAQQCSAFASHICCALQRFKAVGAMKCPQSA